ncbi:(2Fe-2S)-binding protein [Acetobacterium bakii]|uniref:(2Fe-2S)-binding protein n=1 Tax=Acetobacterium bakii TaxID=52689 RepID=A0A0L6U539_9FIRM|nr:(2Fe-2S)-binding protein [Acetobacterium bakii]KNZ43639.1 (2Fe-2S)-binding protein [Acetobacterium bakii]
MNKISISLNLNGEDRVIDVFPNRRVVDLLREDFKLTSVKEGCSEGECGACTVIFNGDAVTTCCMLAGQADQSTIITLEGLAKNGELDVLQQCFLDEGAVQCGYCTPGMILTAKALLMKNSSPTEEEIKVGMSGNLCRCTGYEKIHAAVKNAVEIYKQKLEQGGESIG